MLMAMQHKIIPATHNYVSANTDINIENSPFVLAMENKAWETPDHQPRLGTVSTTGLSGTNAHVVIEEYVPALQERPANHAADTPQIVILSARNPERLQAVVQQMLRFVESGGDLSLADLAYTLQVGREAMECRLATVVRDLDELARALKAFLAHGQEHQTIMEGGQAIPIFNGNLDEERSDMRSLLAGSLGDDLLRLLLAEKHLEKLALYWAKGGKVPWEALHEGGPLRLIALPKYPFARERYWIEESATQPHDTEHHARVDDAHPSGHAEGHVAIPQDAAVVASDDVGFAVHPEQSILENMQRYLVWFLCQETGLTPEQINPLKGMRSYGADSITSSRLMRSVEKVFRVRVTGRELLEHGTIGSLAVYLAKKVEAVDTPEPTPKPAHRNGGQARKEYLDEQVIKALDELEQGTLNLEAVQRIIDG
jgi:acyl transferase domain-containing protein